MHDARALIRSAIVGEVLRRLPSEQFARQRANINLKKRMGFGSRFTCGYYWYCHVRPDALSMCFCRRDWQIIMFKLLIGCTNRARCPWANEVHDVWNGFVDSIVLPVASASCGHKSQVKCQLCVPFVRGRSPCTAASLDNLLCLARTIIFFSRIKMMEMNIVGSTFHLFLLLVVVFVSAPNLHSRIELKCFHESNPTAVDISKLFGAHVCHNTANVHRAVPGDG